MNQAHKKNWAAVLPDVLAPGLDVVFCGSAAGSASARAGAYYAGPGNRFWPILHETGLTPHLVSPQAFQTVLDCRIGLTDMSKFQSGEDSELKTEGDDAHALARKIETYAPQALAFNGKRAARVFFKEIVDAPLDGYGLQAQRLGTTALFVLPSTSGAARRWWDASPWKALAGFLAR